MNDYNEAEGVFVDTAINEICDIMLYRGNMMEEGRLREILGKLILRVIKDEQK